MKKILFVFKDSSLERIINEKKLGEEPADFLFGFDYLNKNRFSAQLINAPRGEVKGLTRNFFHLAEWPFRKITRLGLALEIYPLFKKEIKNADIIFCSTDGTSFGILFWKKIGLIKADVIAMIQSLPERVNRFRNFPLVRRFISSLLNQASVILTFTEFAQKDLIADFRLNGDKIHSFPFGVDTNFWKINTSGRKENFILSIGNDGNRDYPTLIEALPEETELKIITKRPIDLKHKLVKILSGISNEEVGKLYNQALFVVIPSIKVKNESPGQSTAMQAMACGKAVIIPRLPTMEEIFTDREHCLFYEPENAADLREKINIFLADKILCEKIGAKARRLIEEKYNCRKMAERLENILTDLI
ncbi:MAG TPA: glycosyltransferase family 4 protein [Candidatus Methylomirabilis sp.]|nr:glycosyltransferase family 4 protein [Candidatus Methylomirabilis sp.]